MREQRLATEISAAKRERDFYMSRVAKAKATSAQKDRKLKARPFVLICALSPDMENVQQLRTTMSLPPLHAQGTLSCGLHKLLQMPMQRMFSAWCKSCSVLLAYA